MVLANAMRISRGMRSLRDSFKVLLRSGRLMIIGTRDTSASVVERQRREGLEELMFECLRAEAERLLPIAATKCANAQEQRRP